MTETELMRLGDVEPKPWWNLADVCEAYARVVSSETVIIQGPRTVTWAEFDRGSSGIAGFLRGQRLRRQDRIALYLYNCPEYLESFLAAIKASYVPVNTNYRYLDHDLVQLWSDADASAVVFHGAFAETVERVRHRLPEIRSWICVDDATSPCPEWATPYAVAAATTPAQMLWSRSSEDLVFQYTGGTTGIPKAVMWQQQQLLAPFLSVGPTELGDIVSARVDNGLTTSMLPASPLMHATGLMAALSSLLAGGAVVLLEGHKFDPVQLWASADATDVTTLAIVGDAFARPMLETLDTYPGRWRLTQIRSIISSGTVFSEQVKRGILRHLPRVTIFDQFGSSENGSGGSMVTTAATTQPTGTFALAPGARVIDDKGRDIEPGSGRAGVIAIPGGAVGYHKDPERTARTFPDIDGRRYTVAGDFATIDADGTVRLLGRGSVCINSGGEKIFPEEIEESLKSHPAVRDAVVVGVPDQRFGEVVVAVVEISDEVSDVDLISYSRSKVAPYKAPRHILRVDTIGRAPNGKVDYPAIRSLACSTLGLEPQGADSP
jgi:3-oxocholest-4-en-26-oate---CoA ligase